RFMAFLRDSALRGEPGPWYRAPPPHERLKVIGHEPATPAKPQGVGSRWTKLSRVGRREGPRRPGGSRPESGKRPFHGPRSRALTVSFGSFVRRVMLSTPRNAVSPPQFQGLALRVARQTPREVLQ